ncbi:MAG: ABC transporter permease subunit [Ottowia sp.]|nr:ABC transporter permease subunit [Ottowia sp.]
MSTLPVTALQEPQPPRALQAPPHPLREAWAYFAENRGALTGLLIIAALVLVALGADLLAPHGSNEQFRSALLQPPAWTSGGNWSFVLGTDPLGRDILSRIIYGSRYSLLIGMVVVVLATTVGTLLGLVAGYVGGLFESLIMRLMDILLAIPSLLLAIVVVAILGPGLTNAMLAIAVVYMPQFTRLARASVIAELQREYVTASRVAGAGPLRLMFVTILPNCLAPLIVQGALTFSNAILDAAALGFLGLGAQPPIPEWGTMLADARDYITSAWWAVTFPGLAILVTVLAVNIMGDGLRDAFDPAMRRS